MKNSAHQQSLKKFLNFKNSRKITHVEPAAERERELNSFALAGRISSSSNSVRVALNIHDPSQCYPSH